MDLNQAIDTISVDLRELYAAAQGMEAKMRGLHDLQDVNSDLQITNPEASGRRTPKGIIPGTDRDEWAGAGVRSSAAVSILMRWTQAVNRSASPRISPRFCTSAGAGTAAVIPNSLSSARRPPRHWQRWQ